MFYVLFLCICTAILMIMVLNKYTKIHFFWIVILIYDKISQYHWPFFYHQSSNNQHSNIQPCVIVTVLSSSKYSSKRSRERVTYTLYFLAHHRLYHKIFYYQILCTVIVTSVYKSEDYSKYYTQCGIYFPKTKATYSQT